MLDCGQQLSASKSHTIVTMTGSLKSGVIFKIESTGGCWYFFSPCSIHILLYKWFNSTSWEDRRVFILTRNQIINKNCYLRFLYRYWFCYFSFLCCSANSYSLRSVGETLSQLLLQALQFHATNVAWQKVMGDLNFGMHTFCNTSTIRYCKKFSNYVTKIIVILLHHNNNSLNIDHVVQFIQLLFFYHFYMSLSICCYLLFWRFPYQSCSFCFLPACTTYLMSWGLHWITKSNRLIMQFIMFSPFCN